MSSKIVFVCHCPLMISNSVNVSWALVCQIVEYCLNYKAPDWTLAIIYALYYNYLKTVHLSEILNAFFPLCILSVAWYCIWFNGIHLIFLRHQLWIESHISSISPHPEPLTQFLNWIGRTCRRTIILCQRALLIFFFFVSSFCSPSESEACTHKCCCLNCCVKLHSHILSYCDSFTPKPSNSGLMVAMSTMDLWLYPWPVGYLPHRK